MVDYKLTRRDRKFIHGFSKFFEQNPNEFSPEDINDNNNTSVQRKLVKKYLLKSSNAISVETFIVPVSNGTITGYLLTNRKVLETVGAGSLIIYFHGGGWTYGNLDFYRIYLSHLAEEAETNIFFADYRLAPKFKFPVAIEDCYDAFLWATGGAKYWKIDPDRIYIAGDGTGANLAAVTSILARDRKGPKLAGQLLLYPIVDCRLKTQSMINHNDSPTLNEKMLSYDINCYAREPKDILSPMFSPLLSQDLSRLPNALIITGEFDPLLDDSKLYEEALINAGSNARTLISEHSFNGFMPFRHGTGRIEAEGAIWQFVAGRDLEHIQLMSKKEAKLVKQGTPATTSIKEQEMNVDASTNADTSDTNKAEA